MNRIIIRLVLFLFVLSGAVLLISRVAFDVHVYRFGHTFAVHREDSTGYDYLLRLPRGYCDFSGPRPLLIFLHGAGEVGNDINSLREKDVYHFVEKAVSPEDFPFIVLTPISEKQNWEPRRVVAMLEQLQYEHHRFQIDPSRIYLTGYSMGGFGTFATACEYPDLFAAIVPVAGGGEPLRAEKLKNVPTWVFHGELDQTVPPPSATLILDAMKEQGNTNTKLTIIPQAGHGIAKEVYSNPELYQWLLTLRRLEAGGERPETGVERR